MEFLKVKVEALLDRFGKLGKLTAGFLGFVCLPAPIERIS
jgi:hypothetical protein